MGVQVQSATKYINEEGKLIPLSILKRQFISFSYGYKKNEDGEDIPVNIEDFDLLAVFGNDRLEKGAYASFDDTTTEQAELDGQMFWRSNFKAGQLNFELATDGITSDKLEDFKKWFCPGVQRELILTEYHNRAIMARVSEAPKLSLLPFEKEVTVKIGSLEVPTSISLYKGKIELSFVMDDPFWYVKEGCLIGESVSKEEAKMILQDGIPHQKMLQTTCFLADKKFCLFENEGAQILTQNELTISYEDEEKYYLYYCGSAPEKPNISFNISLLKNEETGKVSFPSRLSNPDFYSLAFGDGENQQTLKFTYPDLVNDYNRALDIVKNFSSTQIIRLRKELRDNLFNYRTRSFAIGIIDYAKSSKTYVTAAGQILDGFQSFFINKMKDFLGESLTFKISGKTGEITVEGEISQFDGESQLSFNRLDIRENAGNMIKSNYLKIDTRMLPREGKITSAQCLPIKTNTILNNLEIDYKYKYL